MQISHIALSSIPLAAAFVPQPRNGAVSVHNNALKAEAGSVLPSPSTPIFDPLGLYPENSPERIAGLIQPLESSTGQGNSIVDPLGLYAANSPERLDGLIQLEGSDQVEKEVMDPLRIYSDQSQVSAVKMSAFLIFLSRPTLLDGSLRAFDPFIFSHDASALQWQRKAEIKHARLAMLAAVGWPIAELLHKDIASVFGLDQLLASQDRVPSILNGDLSHVPIPFWIATIAVAASIEITDTVEQNASSGSEREHFMQEAEIFNGRLGMLAITGFAMQEWFLNSAVVDQIPIFFKPLNVVVEQLLANGGAMHL